MKRFLNLLSLVCVSTILSAQQFWLGADISGTTDLEARGVQLRNAKGEPRTITGSESLL